MPRFDVVGRAEQGERLAASSGLPVAPRGYGVTRELSRAAWRPLMTEGFRFRN